MIGFLVITGSIHIRKMSMWKGIRRIEEKRMTNGKSALQALGGGTAGATALTLLHESARRLHPAAPRMDILGMRALSGIMRRFGKKPPPEKRLFRMTMLGDLAANSLYYSLIGTGRGPGVWLRGGLLGLAAGLGAVYLPDKLHLGSWPSARSDETRWMTVALYFFGGLTAAGVSQLLSRSEENRNPGLSGENT